MDKYRQSVHLSKGTLKCNLCDYNHMKVKINKKF